MLGFRRLDVIIAELGSAPDRPAQVIVCWELATQHSGLDRASFTVERSLSPSFPADEYESIADGVAGVPGQFVYVYVDVTPNLISFWRRYFYRVRASTHEGEIVSNTVTWETNPRPHELAIVERHDYVLRYLQGEPSFAFVERTTDSPQCICFDKTAGRSTRSDCTLCLGTGRQRPYFDPIEFYVDYNPDDRLTQIANFGELQTHNEKSCWFSAYPILKPGDIVYQVMPSILWRIAAMKPIQPQGTTIQQLARLESVDLTNIQYQKLRIPQDRLLSVVREWETIKEERLF
jgi:hypothetical protein